MGHFLNELCKRHENKIYVIYVSNTSVPLHHPYPYRNASILLQFLQVIIFCKIVLSSKAAIFSFKLQLFLHFFFFTSVCMLENSCMAEVHTQHTISNQKRNTKKWTSVLLAAVLCQKHGLVFWYKILQK